MWGSDCEQKHNQSLEHNQVRGEARTERKQKPVEEEKNGFDKWQEEKEQRGGGIKVRTVKRREDKNLTDWEYAVKARGNKCQFCFILFYVRIEKNRRVSKTVLWHIYVSAQTGNSPFASHARSARLQHCWSSLKLKRELALKFDFCHLQLSPRQSDLHWSS